MGFRSSLSGLGFFSICGAPLRVSGFVSSDSWRTRSPCTVECPAPEQVPAGSIGLKQDFGLRGRVATQEGP